MARRKIGSVGAGNIGALANQAVANGLDLNSA
jgi:hypothetical protein